MTGIHIRICEWVEEVEKEEPRRRRRSSPALLLLLILKEELRRRRRSSSCAHFPEETTSIKAEEVLRRIGISQFTHPRISYTTSGTGKTFFGPFLEEKEGLLFV